MTSFYKRAFPILFLLLLWSNASGEPRLIETLLPPTLPGDWALIEGPQRYNRKTLFEHIDGQAELYLKYGYQQSVFAAYQDRKKPGNQIEIDIYDMGNVLQAFGVFSRFRNADQPGGIGLDSFLEDRSLLFYQDRYFVMIYADEPKPSAVKELARAVSSKIPAASAPPKEIALFPVKGLQPGSIQYYPEGLLGHRFLKRGFQAAYRDGSDAGNPDGTAGKVDNESRSKAEEKRKDACLFLALFKDAAEAKSALRTFKNYLAQRGKLLPAVPQALGPNAVWGIDPYKGNALLVQKGAYLAGSLGFEKETEAEARLAEMIRALK